MVASKPQIVIGHLYPKEMNVYGDMGNVLTLRYRLEARGFNVRYKPIESLEGFKQLGIDILVGGGGQDSNQGSIHADLKKYGSELKDACNAGLTTLVICGMYQLFGNKFILPDGSELAGLGVLDIETKAGESRLIGNLVVSSPFGKLVGFENHSGRTFLGAGLQPLGKVLKGAGNNGEDTFEGVVNKNVFGTYMHGPVLAKNPILADELIRRALEQRGISKELAPLDDFLELQAAAHAMKRPR